MKLTIAQMVVPAEQSEFEVQIREPGVIRHLAFGLSERPILVSGRPEFEERLAMFVEVSPNGSLRNRRFAVMLPGQLVNPADGYIPLYCGTAVSQQGSIAHLYEIKTAS